MAASVAPVIPSRGEESPSLPGCFAQGETPEEAITLAKEATELHIAGSREAGEPVPEEPDHPQAVVVDVAA